MWRPFLRLARVCLAIVTLVLTAVAIGCYLAVQPPAFYTELRTQSFTPAEVSAANLRSRLSQAAIDRWIDESLARQAAAGSRSSTLAEQAPTAATSAYDPQQDVRTVRFSEQQINSQLASTGGNTARKMQDARVKLSPDRLEFGIEFKEASTTVVLSCMLAPSVTDDGHLRLDVVATRVGKLTLPLRTILRFVPQHIAQSTNEMDIDLNPTDPHFTLKSTGRGSRSPRIKSVRCEEGELVVELLPPVLCRKEMAEPSVALSRND